MKRYILLILLAVVPWGICWAQSEIDSNAREQPYFRNSIKSEKFKVPE